MSVNKAILLGRLGKDPETRYMPNGEAVTNITLATTESFKDKAGVKQERTEWHAITFYRKLAEVAGEYLKKGSMIYVEGKIQTRKWQDKEGKDRYTTEIVASEMTMLGGKGDSSGSHEQGNSQAAPAQPAHAPRQQPAPAAPPQPGSRFGVFDDDVPF